MGLEAEQFPQPTAQPPVEQWPTETPEVSKTKENRSLEGQDETYQAPSDDKTERINISKEKMDVGRNNEEEFGPNEDINKEMDVREDDKPLETDEVGIVYKPDNKGADDEPKSVYVPHIDGGRYDNANRQGGVVDF